MKAPQWQLLFKQENRPLLCLKERGAIHLCLEALHSTASLKLEETYMSLRRTMGS